MAKLADILDTTSLLNVVTYEKGPIGHLKEWLGMSRSEIDYVRLKLLARITEVEDSLKSLPENEQDTHREVHTLTQEIRDSILSIEIKQKDLQDLIERLDEQIGEVNNNRTSKTTTSQLFEYLEENSSFLAWFKLD